MRIPGTLLLFVGLVATVVGIFSGCGSIFSWDGRHPIETFSIGDVAVSHRLLPVAGRRYTISIEVVFERDGLPRRDGVVIVDAQMPLVVTAKDSVGTSLAEVKGWLSPNEPPNVLFGQSARESMRHATDELVVRRIVGPFGSSSPAPITIDINLGQDRIGSARIAARRVVIHDDALPGSIRNAFLMAAGGAVAFVIGLVLVVLGWLRSRRPPRVARS